MASGSTYSRYSSAPYPRGCEIPALQGPQGQPHGLAIQYQAQQVEQVFKGPGLYLVPCGATVRIASGTGSHLQLPLYGGEGCLLGDEPVRVPV